MKLLIIGGNGMAGHVLVRYFRQHPSCAVFYTTRDKSRSDGLFLDVRDPVAVEKVVEAAGPDIVINAAGILNEDARLHEVDAYKVNGLLPHQLKEVSGRIGARLIHISTDCVFSGLKGDYTETDPTDGTSVYARSKALGEVKEEGHLTIRTSIIGPEIRSGGIGLMQWFLGQRGVVSGYTEVYWNGVTTLELAKAIRYYIENPVSGLIHLTAPAKVSKCELLQIMQNVFGKTDVHIVPYSDIQLDRTLRSTRTDLAYRTPDYHQMLAELRDWMRSH